jgi:predicted lipoprotein
MTKLFGCCRQKGTACAWAARAVAVVALVAVQACSTERPKERYDRRHDNGGSGAGSSADAGRSVASFNAERDAGGEPGSTDVQGSNACGAPPILAGEFTREKLRSAAAGCAIWQYCEFEAAASTLRSAVAGHVEQGSEETLNAARRAWVEAMRVWSKTELFQFGPLASAVASEGKDVYQGRGIRERIYSWPSVSACRVEDQVVMRKYAEDMDGVFPSARGLAALEYLLFAPDAASACPAGSATAAMKAALSADELAARKNAYALALADDIAGWARTLSEAWSPTGQDFQSVFVSASGYPSEQEALNVLGWSLIYVERELKDWKLGIPAGQTMTARVSVSEAPYAHVATENMRANLRGFRSLMQGCGPDGEGLGFDDWLESAGHAELASDLVSASQAAQVALDGLAPLHEASLQEIQAAYAVLRELTGLLKGDVFGAGSPLNLKTPSSVEGDTD